MIEALSICVGALAGIAASVVVAVVLVAWENGYFRRG
jgi:hypothetical protein